MKLTNLKGAMYLLLGAVLAAGFTSCKEDNWPEIPADNSDERIFLVEPLAGLTFPKEGGSQNLDIAIKGTNFKVETDADWLKIGQVEGTATASVVVTAQPDQRRDRSAKIIVTGPDDFTPFEIPVKQQGSMVQITGANVVSYGNAYFNGLGNFTVTITDMPVIDGKLTPPGHIALLDLNTVNAIGAESATDSLACLPGQYAVGSMGYSGTINKGVVDEGNIYYSRVQTYGADGKLTNIEPIANAVLTIGIDGKQLNIDAEFVTETSYYLYGLPATTNWSYKDAHDPDESNAFSTITGNWQPEIVGVDEVEVNSNDYFNQLSFVVYNADASVRGTFALFVSDEQIKSGDYSGTYEFANQNTLSIADIKAGTMGLSGMYISEALDSDYEGYSPSVILQVAGQRLVGLVTVDPGSLLQIKQGATATIIQYVGYDCWGDLVRFGVVVPEFKPEAGDSKSSTASIKSYAVKPYNWEPSALKTSGLKLESRHAAKTVSLSDFAK